MSVLWHMNCCHIPTYRILNWNIFGLDLENSLSLTTWQISIIMENATLRFICLVLFLLIFGLFKETLQFLQQINVKNDHLVTYCWYLFAFICWVVYIKFIWILQVRKIQQNSVLLHISTYLLKITAKYPNQLILFLLQVVIVNLC